MRMSNHLARHFPEIGKRLPVMPLADLPTPVSRESLTLASTSHPVLVKHDDVTASLYGGNKVRKLEYILERARRRNARRIATFGAVGSNHAVATALYAHRAGFECTCFLSHQLLRPGLDRALLFHLQHGTELVYFGGSRQARVSTLRRHLWQRDAWVIPLGGTSWLGSIGFVNAGLELAEQIRHAEIPCPRRVYIAFGTMGTGVGLALGLALAGLDIEVQAIRVTEERFANIAGARRLMEKTAALLEACDANFPRGLVAKTRLVCRDEFFGAGYGCSNPATEEAVALAAAELGLALESTYTGKAMAALLHDLRHEPGGPVLFWNTYNSRPLEIDSNRAPELDRLPREFARYFSKACQE